MNDASIVRMVQSVEYPPHGEQRNGQWHGPVLVNPFLKSAVHPLHYQKLVPFLFKRLVERHNGWMLQRASNSYLSRKTPLYDSRGCEVAMQHLDGHWICGGSFHRIKDHGHPTDPERAPNRIPALSQSLPR